MSNSEVEFLLFTPETCERHNQYREQEGDKKVVLD